MLVSVPYLTERRKMDEINAVLELFISCRDSSWPLVRLDAEERLLTQHLLLVSTLSDPWLRCMFIHGSKPPSRLYTFLNNRPLSTVGCLHG